jgi:hypothetical protein
MHPTLRRITILFLFVAFLIPGLAQAQSFDRSFGISKVDGFFSTVWNLLAGLWSKSGTGTTSSGSGTGSGSTGSGDNGGMLDPNGGANGSTPDPENGGMLDPNG